jgi:hypothetical protein
MILGGTSATRTYEDKCNINIESKQGVNYFSWIVGVGHRVDSQMRSAQRVVMAYIYNKMKSDLHQSKHLSRLAKREVEMVMVDNFGKSSPISARSNARTR